MHENSNLDSYTLAEHQRTWPKLNAKERAAVALSGRDQNAVNKTVSGLLKLIQPDGNVVASDEDVEWAVRLAALTIELIALRR